MMKTVSLTLPRHRWPIWLLAAGVVVGLPATAFIYFPALLATGSLPSDGDSISIPIFGIILLSLLTLPLAGGLTYICSRKYVAGTPLMGWGRDRSIVRSIVSVFFLLPAILVVLLPIVMTVSSPTPLIEAIWLPYALCCGAWCLVLRSSAIARSTLDRNAPKADIWRPRQIPPMRLELGRTSRDISMSRGRRRNLSVSYTGPHRIVSVPDPERKASARPASEFSVSVNLIYWAKETCHEDCLPASLRRFGVRHGHYSLSLQPFPA